MPAVHFVTNWQIFFHYCVNLGDLKGKKKKVADLPQDFGTILIIYVTFILHDGRTQAEVGSIPALSSSSVYARVISYHPFSSFTVGRMKFSFFFFLIYFP
jgi:hypothetical protein